MMNVKYFEIEFVWGLSAFSINWVEGLNTFFFIVDERDRVLSTQSRESVKSEKNLEELFEV